MERIGPYEIRGELGRGAMGVVYRGYRPDLEREFAVKVLHITEGTDPSSVRRFEREAKAAARLSGHGGIVGVHDVGSDDTKAWFAMDLIDGQALDAEIDAGDLTPERAVAIVEGAARAVHHAHEQGVLHRDLKPGNIMVASDGTARVADFGLATVLSGGPELTRLTQSGQVLGTPAYMPPEQAVGGGLDARSDVWALGATLYEALTNVVPFDGDTVHAVLLGVIRREPRPLRKVDPRLPAALEVIVGRCLEKDAALRYPTAKALADDLARWRAGEPVLARPPSLGRRTARWARRHRVLVAAGVVGVLAAATVAVALVPGWLEARSAAAEAEAGERAAEEREQAALKRRAAIRPHLDRGREVLRRLDRLFGTRDWTHQQASQLASEARTHFERAREVAPDESDVLLEIGRTYVLVGRSDDARSWFDRAVAADPASTPARLARVLLVLERAVSHAPAYRVRRGSFGGELDAEALLALASADLAHPALGADLPAGAPERRLASALTDLVSGQAGAAAAALERLAEERVTDPSLWYWTGVAWRFAGKDARARAPLERGVGLRPRDSALLGGFAEVLMSEGDLAAALEQFDLAMTGLNVTAALHLNRGGARFMAGRVAEALEDYEAVLKALPGQVDALLGRANVRQALGDRAGALADFDTVIERSPNDALALYNRGNLKREAGDLAGALADYDRAIACDPADPDYWTNRGVARHQGGDEDGALADYDHALGLDPAQVNAATNRAIILRKRGDFANARAALEALLEKDPDCVAAVVSLAKVHVAAGDPAAAAAAFDRAVRLAPDHVGARLDRGVFRANRGDRAGAIRDFERARKLAPPGSQAHRMAVATLAKLRQAR